MINCYDLIKIYTDEERNIQVPALRGCDFSITKGELVSIIGPSGSGKTTLINIMAGLETISSGKLHIADFKLENISPKTLEKYRLSVVSVVDQFPERSLFPNTTVKNNLNFFYSLRYGNKNHSNKEIYTLLEKLDLSNLEKRIVKTLSGGEMTRLAIACALAKNTPILLCDEPTGQLDAKNTENIKKLLREISDEYATTIVVVSHDVRFLEGVDKTYEIIDGRVSSILTKKERETQTTFPLQIKSHIDNTRSVRIPELIFESLKLESDVEFNVSEDAEVRLIHPDGISPA
ncbi:MAG: ABC transporter ATP-binding protein, partial [Candidatus Thorarchaeota archaeon]